MSHQLRVTCRRAFVVCLCTAAFGCAVWKPVSTEPAPGKAPKPIDHAMVYLANDSIIKVDNLVQDADTLRGVLPNSAPPGHPLKKFATPMANVTEVRSKDRDLVRTVAAIGLVAGSVALIRLLLGY